MDLNKITITGFEEKKYDFQNNVQYPVERIGEKLKNPLLRKLILTDKTARGMAEHCYVEYRNLVQILPELYLKGNEK